MRTTPRPAALRAASAALAGLLAASCLQPADEIIDRSGSRGLVFVKEASIGSNLSPMASNIQEFFPGSDLYLLSPISPSGKLTNLTEKWTRVTSNKGNWGAASDPEVSFDGKRILFSMREGSAGGGRRPWQIYELDLESGILTNLGVSDPKCADAGRCGDFDPAYIDDDRIVWASTRNLVTDEYERREAPQLFVGERSGPGHPIAMASIRQITFNQSHDQNPFVHSSGQIFFSRWDHLGDPNKIPLFGVNPDGTGQFVKYGADETFAGTDLASGQRVFMEGRELTDGGIVTSMMERTSDFEGGAIGIVELARFNAPPEIITPGSSPYNTSRQVSQGIFKTPYPILDGGRERILVAQSPREVGGDIRNASVNYDLFVMDKDGGNMRVIHSDPGFNDYDPVVVEPRSLPLTPYTPKPEVAEGLRTKAQTGIFFTANIYSRMQNDGHMRPDPAFKNADGTVGQGRYFRFLEAVPITRGMGGGNVGNRTEFEKQRVIGYGDIRPDGSFSAEVPANRPLHLQVLDQNGMMLVNQLQWINVMPGERRICTGCHGPRDRDADIHGFAVDTATLEVTFQETQKYLSSFANAQKVSEHPAARSDTVDFFRLRDSSQAGTVQAVLDARCNSCHGASVAAASGGGLVLQNRADKRINDTLQVSSVYFDLTREGGYATAKANTSLSYATSDGARNSPLAWVLYNRQLARESGLYRATSHDHSAMWQDSSGRIDPFAPANRDLLTLIEWMDMGIQFSNTVRKNSN